jgi:hypothetical protein
MKAIILILVSSLVTALYIGCSAASGTGSKTFVSESIDCKKIALMDVDMNNVFDMRDVDIVSDPYFNWQVYPCLSIIDMDLDGQFTDTDLRIIQGAL